jgi:uncharacterized protein (DUF2225 family)
MARKIKAKIAIVVLFVALGSMTVLGTTWADEEFVCPVCKTKNTFGVIVSYGSYIYQWPSKYQFIFWPLTDGHVLYSCKKCYLSVLMWDFDKLPQNKLQEIQNALKGVEIKGDYKRYTDIPMSKRLDDDLNTALKTKYEDKQLDKEKNENGEANLSALIKEYIEKIQGPQKPRLMQDQ